MSITYVSLYYFIDRTKWPKFTTTKESYLQNFSFLVDLFKDELYDNFVVFLDECMFEYDIIKRAQTLSNIHIIPINKQFMIENFHAWKFLNKENEIMQSLHFKQLIESRKNCPEAFCAEYNLINHSKVDAIHYTITHFPHSNYYAWIDFGYMKNKYNIPKKLLDLNKLDLNRVNKVIINDISENDKNIEYTMKTPSETIAGYFFFGNKNILLKYFNIYHKELQNFYDMNLVDDDQHIALRCYFSNPHLFHLDKMPWHHALKYYSKE
jgi:hypothetical protein